MKEVLMGNPSAYLRRPVMLLIGLVGLLAVTSGDARAQGEEVTSKIYRYRERVATGYYEGYEVSPRRTRAILSVPGLRKGLFPYGSSSAVVRVRARLPDSHRGLKFYYRNTCIECHPHEARNIHSVRAGITCRQCHGPEPISAINHYYSAMNPIRRHSYVCSKCHDGSHARFATYVIHEPGADSRKAREDFPVLYYAYWFMFMLLAGVLVSFIPHSFMVVLQELASKKGKTGSDIMAFFIPLSYRERLREAVLKKGGDAIDKLSSSLDRIPFLEGPKELLMKIIKAGK